jgi:poly(3-hydroxybutyrate) depolymerase
MLIHRLSVCLISVLIHFVIASPIETTTNVRRATSGCGISHPIAGIGITTYHAVKSGNLTRSYSIHLPSGYNQTQEYPVVVGFHGSSSIGLFFEADTGLSQAKYSGNVSLLLPGLPY